jgi:hypothetical protein
VKTTICDWWTRLKRLREDLEITHPSGNAFEIASTNCDATSAFWGRPKWLIIERRWLVGGYPTGVFVISRTRPGTAENSVSSRQAVAR